MSKIVIPEIVSQKEGGVLAKLWKKIVKDDGHTNGIEYLTNKYLERANEIVNRVQNMKKKTKSSLVKYITADDMTWKTFLDLLFNLLRVVKVEIIVKITYADGSTTFHTEKGDKKKATQETPPEQTYHNVSVNNSEYVKGVNDEK